MANFLNKILGTEKENKSQTKPIVENDVVVDEKNTAEQPKIKTDVQILKGIFTKEDFKEFAKMTFEENKNVVEVILVGSNVSNTNSPIFDMIKSEITVNYPQEYDVNYLLQVVDGAINHIQVVVSEGTDKSLAELLKQNSDLVRIAK